MIKIPDRLEEKLKKDNTNLYPNILIIINKISGILEKNEMEFFPEYTYHGERHIQWVLDFEDKLITEESLKILQPKDIGVLILGTIAHDFGMYISHDGLKTIMKDKTVIDGLDNKTWKELWDDFFEEARRYNDKKIRAIFGKVENFKMKNPNLDKLDDTDRLLYGEFLRKYHHRLAHEIVLNGFPKANDSYEKFFDEINERDKDIVGILGRSHGMDIRDTMEYLKSNYCMTHRPNDVVIFYLMSLIRIADYMHVGGDRAPHLLRNIKKIESPISSKEWDWNEAVKYSTIDVDPESLYVECIPENSEIYIKIEIWIKDMQRELDTCWAILGQAYGGIKGLKDLKLSIRRFDSNIIKQKEHFAKKFVPEKVTFDFDSDLLTLLISPLYGDNPSYGIRELIQNSVDACREMEHITKGKKYNPEINITINNENDEYFFVISDNGVGMTEKTLINYFLKAGASFRRDDEWMKKFKDKSGRTKIQRSGRFGVGVLASFLLGSKIEVTTRSYKSSKEEGLFFEAEINTEQIEVKKIKSEIGTTIRIKLDPIQYDELKNQCSGSNNYITGVSWYSWYRSEFPKININVPDGWKLNVKLDNPEENKLPDKWYKISNKEFNDIKWTYDYSTWGDNWKLCCNGILIPNGYTLKQYSFLEFYKIPRVSLYDYEGNLELNLDRSGLNEGKLPFERELVIDVCKDIIAKLLVTEDILDKSGNVKNTTFNHEALKENSYSGGIIVDNEYLIFKHGYCLSNSYNLEKLSQNNITYVWMDEEFNINKNIFNLKEGIIIVYDKFTKTNAKYILERNEIITDKKHKIISKRFYIEESMFKTITNPEKQYLTKGFKKSLQFDNKNEEKYICVNAGNPSKEEIEVEEITKNDEKIYLIFECYLGECTTIPERIDIFTEIMSKYIGNDVIIPFSLEERRNKYPKAFIELEKYMNKYIKPE